MNEIYLPRDLRDSSISVIIFRCANLFGTEVGKFFDMKMRETVGDSWVQDLGKLRNEYKINLYDPSFVLKEPLYSDSPLRQFLPKSPSFYRKLTILKRLRNDAYHNKFDGDMSQTIASVELFFEVALDIGVGDCAQQFANLIGRLRDIEKGVTFEQDKDIQREQAEREKAISEEKIIELNERLEQLSQKSVVLELEIKEKENNFQKQLIDLQGNEKEFETTKKLLREKEEHVRILSRQNEDEKRRIEEIQEEKVELQEVTKLLAQIVMDDDKLQDFRAKVKINSGASTIREANERKIGSIWTEGKGRLKITLSVRERDLIDPKTNMPIMTISEANRKALAEKWLKIRPSGGRIFVDEFGNACTLINDDLIFLGEIVELASS